MIKMHGMAGDRVGGRAGASGSLVERVVAANVWEFECRDRSGRLKWRDRFKNLVTNVGLNDVLDKYLKGSAYTAAFYVGLTGASPTPAAGDTMASHAGWSEVTAYDEAARQALTLGSVASQSVDNSSSKAVFTISTNGTGIGGAFLATDSTKGGSSGVLYAVGAATEGDRTLADGDTLSVTMTLTMAAA